MVRNIPRRDLRATNHRRRVGRKLKTRIFQLRISVSPAYRRVPAIGGEGEGWMEEEVEEKVEMVKDDDEGGGGEGGKSF